MHEYVPITATRMRPAVALLFASLCVAPLLAAPSPSRVVSREIHSVNFTQSKIGVSPMRKMVIYLPAGYDESPNAIR